MRRATRTTARRDTPDELLLASYADGDPRGFEELFRRYEARGYAFFLRRTGSPERAQDLYQELFLRIHRARDRYGAGRPFAPWLFQIAHRLLVDDVRRAHRAHEITMGEREPLCERGDGERDLANREAVERVLSRLSGEERHILVSAKLEGIGYPELAAQLGKSVEAVRKVASRALQKLRAASILEAPLPSGSR